MIRENQRLIRRRDTSDQLTCIVCPIGCRLTVERTNDADIQVTGNKCKRGAAYAREELRDPRRVVTGTCAVSGADSPHGLFATRLPVRSSAGVPIDELAVFLKSMYEVRIAAPVRRGDTIAEDVGGTGIDLKATMTVEAHRE